MFVLIVIEQFENYYFNPDNPINSFEDVTDTFRKIWSLYCDTSGKKIRDNDVYHFFISLPVPLGYYIPVNKNEDLEIFNIQNPH